MEARDPDTLERLLGGTQCGQCGYDGCRPYAEAMSRGEAGPERCAPGGAPGVHTLARALGQPYREPKPARGELRPRALATVVGALCVGCTRCLDACPVDALAGAQGRRHYVLPALCTGCGLCVPVCPVDCIRLDPVERDEDWRWRLGAAPEDDPERWMRLLLREAENRRRHMFVRERRRRTLEPTEKRRRLRARLAALASPPEIPPHDPPPPAPHPG